MSDFWQQKKKRLNWRAFQNIFQKGLLAGMTKFITAIWDRSCHVKRLCKTAVCLFPINIAHRTHLTCCKFLQYSNLSKRATSTVAQASEQKEDNREHFFSVPNAVGQWASRCSVFNSQVTAVGVRKARQPPYLPHPSFSPLVTVRGLKMAGFKNDLFH